MHYIQSSGGTKKLKYKLMYRNQLKGGKKSHEKVILIHKKYRKN